MNVILTDDSENLRGATREMVDDLPKHEATFNAKVSRRRRGRDADEKRLLWIFDFPEAR